MTVNGRLIIIAFGLFLVPMAAVSDTVVLTSGKTLETDQVWEDADNVFFHINGMKASIAKKNVVRIESINDERPGSKTETEKAEQLATSTDDAEKHVTTAAVEKPAENITPAAPPPAELSDHVKLDGFRDLRWGTPLPTRTDFVEINTESGLEEVKEYLRNSDRLKLGAVILKSIVYAFWRDQLYTVTIITEGYADYIALREEAFNRFGVGRRSDQAHERYVWSDASTDRMLTWLEDKQSGMLWMRSKKMDRLYKLAKTRAPSSYLKWATSE